jgi:hypothetical protein
MFYITIYTNSGQRVVSTGDTQDEALKKHFGEDINIFNISEKWAPGVTDNYVFTSEGEWVEKTFVELTMDDIKKELIISPAIMSSTEIAVTFPNKDQIIICKQIGDYSTLGWIESIYIYYGEFNKGNYGDEPVEEDEDSYYYMVTGGQHFPVSEIAQAEKVFINRALSETPWKAINDPASLTLDEIAQKHPIKTI